ncbi:MAG: hypothetical protein ACXWK0_09210 [Caulobacteraceae bacterium]
MGPLIFVSSLLLGAAQPDSPGQDAASSRPPAVQKGSAPKGLTRRPRTSSPPGTTPMPPMPNVDKGIQLPPNKTPEKPSTPSEPGRPTPDSAEPKDDSVKPVPPAPSKPGEPGVRPL